MKDSIGLASRRPLKPAPKLARAPLDPFPLKPLWHDPDKTAHYRMVNERSRAFVTRQRVKRSTEKSNIGLSETATGVIVSLDDRDTHTMLVLVDGWHRYVSYWRGYWEPE